MKTNYVLLFVIIVNISNTNAQLNQIIIGAVFENNTFYDESIQMLQYAVDEANENILKGSNMLMLIENRIFEYGREHAVSKHVCDLLEFGVRVMFGPQSTSSAYHGMNICDSKEIPYINIYMDEDAATKTGVLNMYPNLDSLNQLLLDYVNVSEWNSMTILYESPFWLRQVAKLLESNKELKNRINIRNLDYNTNNEFRPILQKVRDTEGTNNIVLQCSSESLPIILRQAMQVGLMTPHFKWIITNLDAHSIDLESYQYSGANITIFRIVDDGYRVFNAISKVDDVEDNPDIFNVDPDSKLNTGNCKTDKYNRNQIPNYPKKINDIVSLRAALIYDAVMIFAIAILQLGSDQITSTLVTCDANSAWNKGLTILNYMKNVKYNGLSGRIEFDNAGIRSNITVDIDELSEKSLSTVGIWSYGVEKSAKRLSLSRQPTISAKIDDAVDSLKNKTLTVITVINEPYTMLREETNSLQGNARFEGYAVDLIHHLSLLLGFNYTFVLEQDRNYGDCIDKQNNKWNGMIGEVMSGAADLAIADLTVTSERNEALEFSPSIMNLGIAILFQTPRKTEASAASFMAPFGAKVWYILGSMYIFVSICFFCLGRISPAQWENPYPCIEKPTILENQLSFHNSLWFAAGALLQQGSEIEVKAVSVRVAAAFWWFFTMVIVASYTANLAAFLVAESKIKKINSVEDFDRCGLPTQPPCKAKFGIKRHGATRTFFEHSKHPIFSNMFKVMQNNPDECFLDENKDGLAKVQSDKEDYAFLMESTSLLYYTERYCNVTQVGDLIDDRIYAIGMRKNYKHYHELSEGVLRLQESGDLNELHTKWWKSKKGGGACQKSETSDAESLELDHVIGVFYVLATIIFFAALFAVGDTIRVIRKRSKAANIRFRDQMKIEMKFFMKSLANPDKTRPIQSWKEKQPPSLADRTN